MHGRTARSITLIIGAMLVFGLVSVTYVRSPTGTATARITGSAPQLVSTPAGRPEPLGIRGVWRLRFVDEFNGPRLATRRWEPGWFGSHITPPVDTLEQGCYDRSEVRVTGGALDLSTVARPCVIRRRTYPYRSGIVTTRRSFTFVYGVVQARIYLPGSGRTIYNWPAFWADGTGSWPRTGENDVMEGLAGSASYHFLSGSGRPGGAAPGRFTGWHTYAADWQPGVVTYYYDGVRVGQITTGITASPMFIILDYAVSRAMGGPTRVGTTMKVDYVRVWQ